MLKKLYTAFKTHSNTATPDPMALVPHTMTYLYHVHDTAVTLEQYSIWYVYVIKLPMSVECILIN